MRLFNLHQLAVRMLSDFDAVTPSRLFLEPGSLTTFDAYALQAEVARMRELRGEQVIGYKVGCTSPVVQRQLGISEPIFARIFDTGGHPCGAGLSHQRYANLAVEGELAVRLGRNVSGPSIGADECRAAIVSALPVIELHNYTLRLPNPSVQELIASGGMHAGLVLAEDEPRDGFPEIDSLSLTIDRFRVGQANGTEVAALAVKSVAWLVNRLSEEGLTLGSGAIVLTGSLLGLYPVGPGTRIAATVWPSGNTSDAIVQN